MADSDKISHPKLPVLFIGDIKSPVLQILNETSFLDVWNSTDYNLQLDTSPFRAIICTINSKKLHDFLQPLPESIFSVVYNDDISSHCLMRLQCFQSGSTMIANNMNDIPEALQLCHSQLVSKGPYVCPQCNMGFLTENALHLHYPLYHSMGKSFVQPDICPVCSCEKVDYLRGNFYLH